MKARNIAILGGIIALVLVLTVAEKFAERRQLQRERVESAQQQQPINLDSISAEHDRRWQALSRHTRRVLDSLSREVRRYRASVDSLAQSRQPPATVEMPTTVDSVIEEQPESLTHDDASLAIESSPPDSTTPVPITDAAIAAEYFRGLAALPRDLNAYEKRVATNEVASLVREKYDLTRSRLKELLQQHPSPTVLADDS